MKELTQEQQDFIRKNWEMSPGLIAKELGIHHSTVRAYINQLGGYPDKGRKAFQNYNKTVSMTGAASTQADEHNKKQADKQGAHKYQDCIHVMRPDEPTY